MSVDISGIDKVALLRALWENSKPAAFFDTFVARNANCKPPQFNEFAAQTAVHHYIDYFDGRCIKTDISGNKADPRLYDRDHGIGKFAEIVSNLRKEFKKIYIYYINIYII